MDDLRKWFGKADYENKLEDLSRLQQSSSLEEYLDKFKELLNGVDEQSEKTLIIYFVDGLKKELKSEQNILKPTTLRQAFSVAKVYKDRWPGTGTFILANAISPERGSRKYRSND